MWYDILVVCILLFFLAKGAARGLVWQLAGIAGILLCVTFAGTASKVIGPHINLAPPTNQWAVMFITYLLASFVAFGFARTLDGWIEKMEMKEYNRHLGAIFGLLKGGLLVLIMTFMIVTFSEQTRSLLKDSRAAHISARVIHQIEPVVPDKLHQALGKYIRMFEATGFGEHQLAADEEVLPESEVMEAPLDGDTSLGQQEPLNPFDQLPSSTGRERGSSEYSKEPLGDLAAELSKTVGQRASRMFEEELKAASPRIKAKIEQNIAEALQGADQRSRRQLQQRLLNDGGNGSLIQLFDDWAADTLQSDDVTPPARTSPVTRMEPKSEQTPASTLPKNTMPSTTGKTILDQIVASKSQFGSIQKKLKAEYSSTLQSLPAEIAQNVLDDWYGDLTNSESDIDPDTDVTTPIDGRIIRQMSAARISEQTLPAELRERLKRFRLSSAGTEVLR